MLKQERPNPREPVQQVAQSPAVTTAQRTCNPDSRPREAAARRATEARWRWYCELVVKPQLSRPTRLLLPLEGHI
jgi:hypothetical protein